MWIEPGVPGRAASPGQVRLQARFGRRRRDAELLWFDVPQALQNGISEASHFWLQAVLPLAFRLQEPLECALPADPVWLENARQTLRVWSRWQPDLRPVEIRVPLARVPTPPAHGRTGLFFTGGVDSFYSLLDFDRNGGAGAAPGTGRVGDLLYVKGFDIPLRHAEALERKTGTLLQIARELDKELIVVATNLRETRLRSLEWGEIMHGPALGAVGLMLENRLSTLLLSASFGRQDEGQPWGTHPLTDGLLSSSRTRFVHYGGGIVRFEKCRTVAQSGIALRHLHVCWVDESEGNCGRCEKCVRTQLALELLGVADRASSFPRGPVLEKLKGLRAKSDTSIFFLEELKAAAQQLGRADVVQALEACLSQSRQSNAAGARVGFLRRLERGFRKVRKTWLQ